MATANVTGFSVMPECHVGTSIVKDARVGQKCYVAVSALSVLRKDRTVWVNPAAPLLAEDDKTDKVAITRLPDDSDRKPRFEIDLVGKTLKVDPTDEASGDPLHGPALRVVSVQTDQH